MNDGGGKWWWSLFRCKPVLSLGLGLREGMTHVGLKAMSREKSVSRAMGKWKQRVKEVYRPCWLCLSSGSQWYEMVCVLEASDYFSMGLPEQQSSQDVAFSKSLGEKKRGWGDRKNGSLVWAAYRKHILQNCFFMNGNWINSLSSSFKWMSSCSWQNWIGNALILFWLWSNNKRDFSSVELQSCAEWLQWTLCRLSSSGWDGGTAC